MDIQITNPHILETLEDRGFKVKTGDEATNELVQGMLFELGFEWSDGKKLAYQDATYLAFTSSGLSYSKSTTRFEISDRKPYTIRAVRGLALGSKLVAHNNIKDATHTRPRQPDNRLYLVTHEATYYWNKRSSEWKVSVMPPSEFASCLEAISDEFDFDTPELNGNSNKPKTQFDDVW
ncbi:hypothetical protein [Acinetobacter nosocomialis]|uniref:hypothetical protein n=1 Tax=Acinetobacter nosocomialis TaxID=106654 RepID=UPI0033B75FFA